MIFWQNVSSELEYQSMSRKELAFKSEVPLSTINKGMQRNSNCYAEDALKIARALNVSLEYLLGAKNNSEKEVAFSESIKINEINLFHKYKKTLYALEKMKNPQKKLFIQLIESFSE